MSHKAIKWFNSLGDDDKAVVVERAWKEAGHPKPKPRKSKTRANKYRLPIDGWGMGTTMLKAFPGGEVYYELLYNGQSTDIYAARSPETTREELIEHAIERYTLERNENVPRGCRLVYLETAG